MLLWGVAAAWALGAVLGLIARPELIGQDRKPMAPAKVGAPTAPEPPSLRAVLADAKGVEPAPTPDAGPLDLGLAPPPTDARPPVARDWADGPPVAVIVAPPPEGQRPPAVISARPEAAPRRADSPGPSFDCSFARSYADEVVCSDPELAAADRALDRAYRRARDAGAPDWVLRQRHAEWSRAREAAAREGAWAVDEVYRARIDELNDQSQAYAADPARRLQP